MKVNCTVLTATDGEKEDARKNGVHLLLPQIKKELDGRTPSRDWLLMHESCFPNLKGLRNLFLIFGHDCHNGTIHIAKCFKKDIFPRAKLVTMIYRIPECLPCTATEIEQSEKQSLEHAKASEIVVSVGSRVRKYFQTKFRTIGDKEHLCYWPCVENLLSNCDVQKPSLDDGINLLSFHFLPEVDDIEDIAFEEFDIIANAIGKVSQHYRWTDNKPSWKVRGIPEKLCADYNKRLRSKAGYPASLRINSFPSGSLDTILDDLKQSHLVVLGPGDQGDSFGIVGLLSSTVGVPIVISGNCGFAAFLMETFPGLVDMCVVDSALVPIEDQVEEESIKWEQHIMKILQNYSRRFDCAQELKKAIRGCASAGGAIAESKNTFIEACHRCAMKWKEEMQCTQDATERSDELIPPRTPGELRIKVQTVEMVELGEANEGRVIRGTKIVLFDEVDESDLPSIQEYIKEIGGTMKDIIRGCLLMTVECLTLETLDRLWADYQAGVINRLFEKDIINTAFIQKHGTTNISLETIIETWEYMKCKIEISLRSKVGISEIPGSFPMNIGDLDQDSQMDISGQIARISLSENDDLELGTKLDEKETLYESYDEELAETADTETQTTAGIIRSSSETEVSSQEKEEIVKGTADIGMKEKKTAPWQPIPLRRKHFPDYLDVDVWTDLKHDSKYVPAVRHLLDTFFTKCEKLESKLKKEETQTEIFKNMLYEGQKLPAMSHSEERVSFRLSMTLKSKKITISKLKEENKALIEENKSLKRKLKKSKFERYNSVEIDDETMLKSGTDPLTSLSMAFDTSIQKQGLSDNQSKKTVPEEPQKKEMTLEEGSAPGKQFGKDEFGKGSKEDKDRVFITDAKKTERLEHEVEYDDSDMDTGSKEDKERVSVTDAKKKERLEHEVDSDDSNTDTGDSESFLPSSASLHSEDLELAKTQLKHLLLQSAVLQGHSGIVQDAISLNIKKKHIAKSLRFAVLTKNAEIVKLLLDTGIDVEEINKALVASVKHGYSSMVQLLLDSGGDVNATDSEGEPLLHSAVRGNAETLRLLLRKGADVNATDSLEDTALHVALEEDKGDAVKVLVKAGSDIKLFNEAGQSALHLAAEDNRVSSLTSLLAGSLDVNMKDQSGNTPLHLAAANDNIRIIRLLIDAGADLTIKNKSGHTATSVALVNQSFETLQLLKNIESEPEEIHVIKGEETSFSETKSEQNFIRLVKSLLQSGGDINAKDRDGNIPLHIATQNNWKDAVTYLLDKEADIESFDKNAMTPFHVAALLDHVEIQEYFVEKGGDVNKTDLDGLSPLHFAVSGQDCVGSVSLLVDAKADTNLKDKKGKTPLHMAVGNNTRKATDIVNILCDGGANVNAKDKQMKETPLHIAARNNNVKVAAFLIDRGAYMNTMNKHCKTPLEIALDQNCAEVASLLVGRGAGANTL
ncbi:uncharacterized protein [Ptychodera flava]|uniref:uncharacterized protein n=1 Tax=Ptychodera flava TaxID=63121 RepID=UPI00396A1D2E